MPDQVGPQPGDPVTGEQDAAVQHAEVQQAASPPARDPAAAARGAPGVEFAWRVHAVQEQWASRADTKAAVVFTVQGAVIAGVVAAFANDKLAALISGWRVVAVWSGVVVSMVAVAAALLVVLPQLGGVRRMRQEAHVIYFGHLRTWDVAALKGRLVDMSDAEQIEQLAVQLTRVAAGNWRKYVLLRIAVIAAFAGGLLLVLAFAWPRVGG